MFVIRSTKFVTLLNFMFQYQTIAERSVCVVIYRLILCRDRPILLAVSSALLNSSRKWILTTIITCRASEFILYSKSTPYVITNASDGITTLALTPFRLSSNYRYSLHRLPRSMVSLQTIKWSVFALISSSPYSMGSRIGLKGALQWRD